MEMFVEWLLLELAAVASAGGDSADLGLGPGSVAVSGDARLDGSGCVDQAGRRTQRRMRFGAARCSFDRGSGPRGVENQTPA